MESFRGIRVSASWAAYPLSAYSSLPLTKSDPVISPALTQEVRGKVKTRTPCLMLPCAYLSLILSIPHSLYFLCSCKAG